MIRLLVTAPASGGGKTALTCALLRAMQRRGVDVCAFKCGPDYIDPMFHRTALGADSHNLDLFLAGEDRVRAVYARYAAGHGAAICEGVMGHYDGLGGTDRASAWHLADTLDMPALLVLRPKGASLTLAALVKGLNDFRTPSHLAAILLNDCTPALANSLAPMLERETGLPVVGFLPHVDQAALPSRHLGLVPAGEIPELTARLDALGSALEANADIDRLLALCDGPAPEAVTMPHTPAMARIAVALDEAFCFAYAESLDALVDAGAELVFFSPIHDERLPENIGGLYLPGGYPELHARALAENESMRAAVRSAVENGLPTVAECGGYLYLCQSLTDETGRRFPMAGVLPGDGTRRDRPVRFGYADMIAGENSLLFRAGESVPVHEFHYWDTECPGGAFRLEKPVTDRTWAEGYASPTLYAGFPHLYFAGRPELASRFVLAAKEASR